MVAVANGRYDIAVTTIGWRSKGEGPRSFGGPFGPTTGSISLGGGPFWMDLVGTWECVTQNDWVNGSD